MDRSKRIRLLVEGCFMGMGFILERVIGSCTGM